VPPTRCHVVMGYGIPSPVYTSAPYAEFVVERKNILCRDRVVIGSEIIEVLPHRGNRISAATGDFIGQGYYLVHICGVKGRVLPIQERTLVEIQFHEQYPGCVLIGYISLTRA